MPPTLFIVAHQSRHYGPFRDDEVDTFTAALPAESFDVLPLTVPDPPNDSRKPVTIELLTAAAHREHVDGVLVDSQHELSCAIQTIYQAREERRVLTAAELMELWGDLYQVARAVESLMHHSEAMINTPNEANRVALRQAFWRNRGTADSNPHYRDQYW